jgi:fibronectin type 3 domain-containing protein
MAKAKKTSDLHYLCGNLEVEKENRPIFTIMETEMNTSDGYPKTSLRAALAGAGLITALVFSGAAQAQAVKLSAYNADPSKTTVSGISSGGYMAVQMHVAYSATFKPGVAVFAGGPFYCAKGSLSDALNACLNALPSGPDVTNSVNVTKSYASAGSIDATSNLGSSKVYMFSGTKDSVVKPAVMDALKSYYLNFVPSGNITYNNGVAAEHAWISPYGPNACGTRGDPYISNCSIDPQNTFLTMFYGSLNAKNTGTLRGSFVQFDQKEFFNDKNPKAHSVADSGWMYVPADCAKKMQCKVHVSYHGCVQNYDKIGDKFVKKSGLNEWADTNRIIVVYPQTISSSSAPSNPNGCWDWWGYDDPNYAKKSGRQMLMSKRIVDRITSGFVSNSTNPAPTGLTKGTVTYNSVPLSWTASSGATGYNVYRSDSAGGARTKANASTLASTTTSYTVGGLEPNTTYYFVVRATDSGGLETVDSNQISATTPDAPLGSVAAPSLSAGTPTDKSVPLSWAAVSGSHGTNIYLSTAADGIRNKVNANPITTTSYTVGGLKASTTYYFRARSLDSAGLAGSESGAISAKTADPPFCKLWSDSNYNHVSAGRATQNSASHAIAKGSGQDMGLNNTYTMTTLKEAPAGYYVISKDCDSTITAPTGLTIGTITNNSVALSWNSVTNAAGYNAYYATTPIGALTRANGGTLITGTSYTVGGLQSATTYYFQVRAQDSAGTESQLSDQKLAKTTSNTVAAPTNLAVTAVSTSSVSLGWTASSGAAGYNVYSSDRSAGVLTKANEAAVTTTSYKVDQLAGNTKYFFVVKAYDSNMQESPASNEVSATTNSATAPSAPTGLSIGSATDTSLTLAWTASTSPDLQGTNVYYGTASGGPYAKHNAIPTSQTSYKVDGLKSSTNYYMVVRAINLSGLESANSAEVNASTATAKPAQPTNLRVLAGTTDTKVPLAWTASTGPNLSGYNIYTAKQTNGPYTKANGSLVTTTSYAVTKLSANTSYYFMVRAKNSSGVESVNSNEVAAKTLPATYCKVWYASNYYHVQSSPKRATTDGSYAYAVGSGTNMGLYSLGVYSYLRERPQGYYTYSSTALTCP